MTYHQISYHTNLIHDVAACCALEHNLVVFPSIIKQCPKPQPIMAQFNIICGDQDGRQSNRQAT